MSTLAKGNYYFKNDLALTMLNIESNTSYTQKLSYKIGNSDFTHVSIYQEVGIKYTDYRIVYERRNASGKIIQSVSAYSVLEDNKTRRTTGGDWIYSSQFSQLELQSITIAADTTVEDDFYHWFVGNVLSTEEKLYTKIHNLKLKINEATNQNFQTLTEAVNYIIDAYKTKSEE